MFVESRDDARGFFIEVWRKMATGAALEPLEAVVAQILSQHPEYHDLLGEGEGALTAEFDDGGQANPFLHLGLHVALVEQLQTDRPAGVRAMHQQLAARHGPHEAEHRMMACLIEALREAQVGGRSPDDAHYLKLLRRLD